MDMSKAKVILLFDFRECFYYLWFLISYKGKWQVLLTGSLKEIGEKLLVDVGSLLEYNAYCK
jgi:hypothetical protein